MNTPIAIPEQDILRFKCLLRGNQDVQVSHVSRAQVTAGLHSHNRPLDRQNTNPFSLKPFHDSPQFCSLPESPQGILPVTVFQITEYGSLNAVSCISFQAFVYRGNHMVAVNLPYEGIPIGYSRDQRFDSVRLIQAGRGPKAGEEKAKLR